MMTDRYTKAISQLGDPRLAIRLAASMPWNGSRRLRPRSPHRLGVLSAFIRHSSQPTASNRLSDDQSGARPEEQPAPAGITGQTLPTDVQAALTVLGRLPSRSGVSRGDLVGVQLVGARFDGADLTAG